MAIVQGIREKVHLPIYDSIKIDPGEMLGDVEPSGTLRFFVNVQNKTKLETNLQSASLLPHYNTFEARAMRVVISDLPPVFSDEKTEQGPEPYDPVDDQGNYPTVTAGTPPSVSTTTTYGDPNRVQVDVDITLERLVELLQEADDSEDGIASVDLDDEDVIARFYRYNTTADLSPLEVTALIDDGRFTLDLTAGELEALLDEFPERDQPLPEQLYGNNGSGNLIGKMVYNTVTTLYVGEKVMIQMPTWFFPGGAGPFSETASITTHGTPSPQDTFRFAEPIFIDRQQNFRVEIEIPDADVLKDLQRIYGPMNIWVVLDGYMTRGVQ